ncbi:dTDP-4-dehydrorhamnose reductase [Candidatus Uhrbacteria bacterium]|nr:dTDP-4-dehydrorhamnose reductase [Candidatus Uhrbacteria bacterium]
MKPNVFIVGYKGQLGTELRARLEKNDDYTTLFVDRDELDITNEKAVQDFFARNPVNYCINCAAYTDVEGAEKNEEAARVLNAAAVGILARACRQADAILFHVSTDFVFDGRTDTPYTEQDTPNPLSVYGQTKLEGEHKAFQHNPKTVVIRTAWLYSPYGKNFVKTMLRLGSERQSIDVVCDQVGSPTYAGDLADALVSMIKSCGKKSLEELEFVYGTYHVTNSGSTSWYEFSKTIMEYAGLRCCVQPIEAKHFPSVVKRPSFSVLNTSKIQRVFGIIPPDWRASLRQCIQKMI